MSPTMRSLIGASLLAITATAPSAADLTRVTAGHLVALDMAPLFVASESGCFERHGLSVELRFFANPGDNNAALAGGAIDFSTNPFTLPFFAANSGVPIRTVSAAGGWGIMEVIAHGEHKLGSMEDLRAHVEGGGRPLSVAVLQGDTLELIMISELARVGLDADAVRFVYFDDLLAMVEAFRNNRVDMLSHIKPYTSQMVEERGATVLTNNATAWSEQTPNTVVSVLERTLEQRPEIVKAYLQGLICAADIINNDLDRALEYLTKGNYFRVSDPVLRKAFESAPQAITFTPDVEAVQGVVDELARMQYIGSGVAASDIFRLDIIKALEQQ